MKNKYRLSASLVIIKNNTVEEKYEVLMLKRANTSSFPSALVFPGGLVDKVDNINNWINFNLSNIYKKNDDIPLLTLKLTAIRETFEETGILLTFPSINLTEDEVMEWREKLEADSENFIQLCKHYNVSPNVDALHYISDWEPTRLNHKSHHVYLFSYLTQHPINFYQPNTKGSLREVDFVEYREPKGWINGAAKGEIFLPPQLYTLVVLNRHFQNYSNLKSHLNTGDKLDFKLGKIISKFQLIQIDNENENLLDIIPKDCKLIIYHIYPGDYQYDNDDDIFDLDIISKFPTKNINKKAYHRVLTIVQHNSPRSISLITNLNLLNPGLLVYSINLNKFKL